MHQRPSGTRVVMRKNKWVLVHLAAREVVIPRMNYRKKEIKEAVLERRKLNWILTALGQSMSLMMKNMLQQLIAKVGVKAQGKREVHEGREETQTILLKVTDQGTGAELEVGPTRIHQIVIMIGRVESEGIAHTVLIVIMITDGQRDQGLEVEVGHTQDATEMIHIVVLQMMITIGEVVHVVDLVGGLDAIHIQIVEVDLELGHDQDAGDIGPTVEAVHILTRATQVEVAQEVGRGEEGHIQGRTQDLGHVVGIPGIDHLIGKPSCEK